MISLQSLLSSPNKRLPSIIRCQYPSILPLGAHLKSTPLPQYLQSTAQSHIAARASAPGLQAPPTPPMQQYKTNTTLLCTTITAETVAEAVAECTEAKQCGAHIVELRLDLYSDLNGVEGLKLLAEACKAQGLPFIATYRPTWEGGKYDGPEEPRLQLLKECAILGAAYIDCELKATQAFSKVCMQGNDGMGITRDRLILSSHNYESTPAVDELLQLVQEMEKEGAAVAKIAVTANKIEDCQNLFRVLEYRLQGVIGIPVIALAMGERGQITRILAGKYNAFLTFAALGKGRESAPGQPSLADMQSLYRLSSQNTGTRVYGIVGNPVSHSRSPVLHNSCFEAQGWDGVYVPLLVDDMASFLSTYKHHFAGMSVTIPHKEAALLGADEVDPVAQQIGAVNTLIKQEDTSLKGYNTDWSAAIGAVEDAWVPESSSNPDSSPLKGQTVVVLGAGGAGKALAFGAASRGAEVIIANRGLERAEAIAAAIGGQARAVPLAKIQSGEESGAVLCNTTSLGMHPKEDQSPVQREKLGKYKIVFDAIYTPMVTKLLEEAEKEGCTTVSGLEMFLGQAALQFQYFTSNQVGVPIDLMRQVVTASLQKK